MKRLHQTLLIGSFLPFCWLGLQAVRELSHVVGAMVAGVLLAECTWSAR